MNIVRFSPNGELFCSGSADGKATLYDGKTAEKKAVLGGDTSHAGGINCVSYFLCIIVFILTCPRLYLSLH